MEYVSLRKTGSAAYVTIDRPKYWNALNTQVYEEIAACLEQAAADPAVRAVILTGAGEKAFAAGADIAQMVEQSPAEGRAFSQLCHKVGTLLETMRPVTIAAINGLALGGGFEMTLACDIRIAAEHAKFALPEVGLGIIPGGGGTQRLARIVGIGRAKELIFTGDKIDAAEAYRIGLVNHVLPLPELLPYCEKLAARIAGNSGAAIELAKSAINTSMDTDITSGVLREIDLLGLAFALPDKKEGMTAFLEKRKPQF